MKLVLINPKFPESFWSFSWALENITTDKKTVNSPLGLATLAALTPPHWEIEIIDENVEAIDWSLQADIVGVCGMGVQEPRQKEILEHFRKRGIYVVSGGSYASLCPEEYSNNADTVIAGEAELIWPQFCADFEKGEAKPLYHECGEIDLALSPVPRYDLLKTHLYQKFSLQFSRGCPFRCEFCDIIVMFGRKPRTKTTEQVGQELDLLRSLGITSVFFVDDNFIGHLPKARELLKFLADYQEQHHYRFSFGTEATINMAADPDLMSLFQKANFEWVFIGIETPSKEGLTETKKTQNLRQDLLESIRTIYSYGIEIFAGFIIGFDADDQTIFDRQYDFIVNSGITVSMVGLLNALPKTPLYERLAKEGRLRDVAASDNTSAQTNVVPLQMSYQQMVSGYENLQKRLTDETAIYQRIENKLRYLRNPINGADLSLGLKILYLSRLMFRGIFHGGFRRLRYFAKSLLLTTEYPEGLSTVVTDWIAGLSLQDYRIRHLQSDIVAKRTVIQLAQAIDWKLVRRLGRTLKRSLRKHHDQIVLDCRTLEESCSRELQALLKKLRHYRHQVHIQVTDRLYQRIQDELVFFQYTLVPSTN